MLDWLLKKNKPPAAAPETAVRSAPLPPPAPPGEDWPLKLQAAAGDDTALLALLRASAPVDVKMAAVAALTGEASLKLAEREHRDHDRRVHRLAKQRYVAQVAVRETAEQASRLIDAASALLGEPVIPSNRLVELDRAWQALNLTLLEASQRVRFEALLAQLGALTRERGDEVLKIERWAAEARAALSRVQAACAAAALGTEDRSHLAAASASARTVFEAAPAADASAALKRALQRTLQCSARRAPGGSRRLVASPIGRGAGRAG
jgi:DNA repair protein SbcC/Rad50